MPMPGTPWIVDQIRAAAEDVARHARRRIAEEAFIEAPERSGRLRSEIRVEGDDVVSATPYASFVHEGTSRQKANPYLRRAVDTVIGEIETE